ncbi:MAG: bifunctional folylpolyglutamate synthase/dihydrofolate synthase [Alphaproteobacteria bacterium]|nr:bifunctional folylpolyglutamate synthase/dihydrofolate synthase [Alphaproteobacteria bacterium]
MVWLPHWPRIGEMSSMKLGLSRMESILSALGNPEKNLPPVIHVAGTNGKGSTTAFLKSISEQMGLSVHVLTSPHLTRFNERIVLAGSEISDDYLFSILEEVRIIAESDSLEVSFFEGITAAAFLAFSRVKADLVILETGLGGRLDATNVLEKPSVTIITPISYDHMNVLGDTLPKIAREKCGIIRKNVPCVVSMQTEEVYNTVYDYANNLGAPLIMFENDYGVSKEGDLLSYKSKDFNITVNSPSLPGDHQYINAATAIAALRRMYGNKITQDIVEKGLKNTVWRGRLQKITSGVLRNKIPESWEVWVECAHNISGAQALGVWMETQLQMDTFFIFSMTRNRDVNSFLSFIENYITKLICTDVKSEPSAYKGIDIPSLIQNKKLADKCVTVNSVEDGVNKIIQDNKSDAPKRIIITGSIFLVSDFLLSNKN